MAARRPRDRRPPVAIGHVCFEARDVAAAAAWLEEVGLRPIASDDDFAVMELRGGTHLVVTAAARKRKRGAEAPFDLMVDDIDKTRRRFAAKGLAPSRIHCGAIRDSFELPGPDGVRVTVLSSHAGRRAV
ncbi:MAG TPA: VOC family protein [Stellaceae bacterium]|nr:VOC family protein [Stellaceae bacterium]